MLSFLKAAVDDGSADQRAKIGALYALLLAANALVWTWAVIALADQPTLLGTAVLAYVLGLRHAVDADHIAAIDNVVRKLMQESKRPVSAGLSVVVALIIGGIEALGLIADKLGLEGEFWDFVGDLKGGLANLGYLIVGVFLLSWAVSYLVYRWQRLDRPLVKGA